MLLLQKPVDHITLEAVCAPMFVAMLEQPYPMEPENRNRMLRAKAANVSAGQMANGKIGLAFGAKADTLTLSKAHAARLGADVTSLYSRLVASPG